MKPFIREGRTGIDTALDGEEVLSVCNESNTVAGRLALCLYECEIIDAEEFLSILMAYRFDIRERNSYDKV